MIQLQNEIASFKECKDNDRARAHANAALLKTSGVDLDEISKMTLSTIAALRIKLKRLLERERLRGLRRHSSYDLNKHIGLKTALDLLGA